MEGAFKPFFGISADNRAAGGEILNDIDIDAIYVKNADPTVYNNKNDLENERLSLIAEKYEGERYIEGEGGEEG